MRYTAFLAMVVAWATTAGAQGFWIGPNYRANHIVTPGDVLLGGTLNLVVAGSYVPNGAQEFNVITSSDNIVGDFESTNRTITRAGRVWGDYKENNPGPGADRYYVPPRRAAALNGTSGVTGADFTVWADNVGQASIEAKLVPVSTYGYGYGVGDSAPVVAEVDIALMAAGDRESLSDSAGFNGSTNAVPEPSTVLLGGLALAGLVVVGRRRAGK